MEPIARKSDGRRMFTPEFKRQQIERVLRGELTLAELSRELQISSQLLARWKTLITAGAETAVQANEEVVPSSTVCFPTSRCSSRICCWAVLSSEARPRFYGVSKK